MNKTIGFVLNAPVNYSETFLLREFDLLEKTGYKILVFEGYDSQRVAYHFKRIQSLPIRLKKIEDGLHCFRVFSRLLLFRPFPLLKFVYLELQSGTSLIRTLKRVWLNAHILGQKIDFLHFCFADVAIQKELTAKAINARMSVSLRGSDILIYPQKNINCYARLWKYTDKIHAVSQYVLGKSQNLGLNILTKTLLIPDAIDPSSIIFNSTDIRTPLRILSVGRLEPVKDFNFAVDVINYLIKNKINLHYTLIGKGSLISPLIRKVKELDIENWVTFRGFEEHNQILKEMSSYDFFFHSSRSEGLGVALLEAQAAGLLTIALDAGGTEESIEDGKSGWIIRKREPEEVLKKIIEILKMSSEDRMKIKSYARKRIEEKFNIENFQSQWKDFFNC